MLKKQRYKPFYKKFIRIRKNIQNRFKLLKFKKQKWSHLQSYSLRQLRFFRRYRMKDQFSLKSSRFASWGNSYKKTFRNSLLNRTLFKLFYGDLKIKYIKSIVNKYKNKQHNKLKSQLYVQNILNHLESRLDVILYRTKFSYSIKNARQLILHGHILVNGTTIRTNSYIVKQNDLIEVAENLKTRTLIQKNIYLSNFWPIPPRYLHVNYLTLQIIIGLPKGSMFTPLFSYYLNLNSVISDINRY